MVRPAATTSASILDLAAALAADETPAVLRRSQTAHRLRSASNIADAAQRPRYQAWIRDAVRARAGRARPAGHADATPTTCRAAGRRCWRWSASPATTPSVQRRARELAPQLPRRPGVDRSRSLAPTVLQIAAVSRRSRALRPVRGAAAEARRTARGVLPLLQRARLVPRSGARAGARSNSLALADGALAGYRLADRAGCCASRGSRDAAWAFIKAQWPALVSQAWASSRASRASSRRSAASARRRARGRHPGVLRQEPGAAVGRARRSRRSSASRAARRSTRASRRRSPRWLCAAQIVTS